MIQGLCCLLIAAALVLGQPSRAAADGLRPHVLSELFSSADVVMKVEIAGANTHDVEGEQCGTAYTANVLEVYKAPGQFSEGPVVNFGRSPGLEFGAKYLVFMNFQGNEEELYAKLLNDPHLNVLAEPKEKVFELIRCQGMVPGLIEEFAWVISIGDVVVPPEVLLQFPDSLHVDDQSGTMYFIRETSLSAYLHELAHDDE